MMLFAAGGAYIPTVRINAAIRKRSRKLEEQFPDALDFLSRAMRAGHAFSVSLEMLAEESREPMRSEFRKLYHEQNLGAPIEVALQAMADRCKLMDVQFFVSAVLLQRETGGNLTEILIRLAHTIRERLRLKGQVRAASAHGRVTGLLLTIMPIILMGGFMVISPNYLNGLVADEHGRILIAGALIGQVLGYASIRKITNVEV
jgi:tight adherence protein B